MQLPTAPSKIGDHLSLKNTYLAEFPPELDVRSHFQAVTDSLRASKQIGSSEIRIRNVIRSSLFNGVSFSTTSNDSIEAAIILQSAIDVHPVYSIPAPRIIKSSFASDKAVDGNTYSVNAFDLTGVSSVHKQFNNYGAGVRVSSLHSRLRWLVFRCR